MPSPGIASTWGSEQWAAYVLDHLSLQSVLLRSGARRINVVGTRAHVPRLLSDGTATWTAEAAPIASSAPAADTIELIPKKVANLVTVSNESVADADVSVLNAVGDAMTRSVALALDAKALSADAATAIAPAGIRAAVLPGAAGTPDLVGITTAVGVIGAAGGVADACYLNPADLTAIRLAILAGTFTSIVDPTAPGIERIAGARLWPTPAVVAGSAIVAQADQILVGIRQDAEVAFSPDAAFDSDGVAVRVTARADFGVNDPNGIWVIA
jgi:HK97 family phage major capsid protein